MRRKLVQQGKSTLMVSLPSTWIKRKELEKGDEVVLNESQGSIIVDTDKQKKSASTHVHLQSDSRAEIRTHIVNSYRAGYDKINVEFHTQKAMPIIESMLQEKLIGFEVTQTKEDAIVIENITEPEDDKFDIMFTKIFQNIKQMLSELQNGQTTNLEAIQQRVLKYDNFCRRVISKRTQTYKSGMYLLFLSLIIHANREVYHAAKAFPKDISSIKKQLEQCEVIVATLQKAYFKKDLSLLSKLHKEERNLIFVDGHAALEVAKKDVVSLHHLLSALRRFYQASSPLTSLLLSADD